MKKLLVIMTALAFVVGFSAVSFAAIDGSAHDFATAAWNGTGEICITCHTPHNAQATFEPLWNHTVTSASYTLYSSGTLDATLGQPDGISKLCLSCHDGTVALDAFGGNTVSPGTMITGNALLGEDLSNDHPVSFTYDNALSTDDGELYDPTTQSSGLGGTIDQDMLFSNRVECASCHDAHNSEDLSYLLRIDNSGSALCLTCHNK